MSSDPDRLRRPPSERFVGLEHAFDLTEVAEALRREPREPKDGHRQITLFHDSGFTLIMFDLEAGGWLADHQADGIVTIHTTAGEIEVSTAEAAHRLSAGSVLVLSPGIRHDVRARVASRMLLSVYAAR